MNILKKNKRSMGIISLVLSFVIVIMSFAFIVQVFSKNLDNSFDEKNLSKNEIEGSSNNNDVILENDECNNDENEENNEDNSDIVIVPDDIPNENDNDEINNEEDIKTEENESIVINPNESENVEEDNNGETIENDEPKDDVVDDNINNEDLDNSVENEIIELSIIDKAMVLIANSEDSIYNKTFYYFVDKNGVLNKTKVNFDKIELEFTDLCERLLISVNAKYGNVSGITEEMIYETTDSIYNILNNLRNILLANRI